MVAIGGLCRQAWTVLRKGSCRARGGHLGQVSTTQQDLELASMAQVSSLSLAARQQEMRELKDASWYPGRSASCLTLHEPDKSQGGSSDTLAFEGLPLLWGLPDQLELLERRGGDLCGAKGTVFCYKNGGTIFAPDHCCQKKNTFTFQRLIFLVLLKPKYENPCVIIK